MCGRYQLQVSASSLQAARSNTSWRSTHDSRHNPRQQVRPTTTAPVLISTAKSTAAFAQPPVPASQLTPPNDPGLEKELVIMQWGFITNKGPSQPSRPPLINARLETVLELPTFRRALFRTTGSRRCAIPVTAFYEWHRSPPPGKPVLTPYQVRAPQQLSKNEHDVDVEVDDVEVDAEEQTVAYMAGLYDDNGQNEGVQQAFVVLTTGSSPDFSWLHSRQPVFLTTEEQLNYWLNRNVSPVDAVASLSAETGLVCTRMLKDLSAAAPKGRDMQQKGITSFFAKRSADDVAPKTPPKASLAQTALRKMYENPLSPYFEQSKKPVHVSNVGSTDKAAGSIKRLKPAPVIKKAKDSQSPQRTAARKGGQRAITSFFTKDNKDA